MRNAGRWSVMACVAMVATTQACDCDVEPIVAVQEPEEPPPDDVIVPQDPPVEPTPDDPPPETPADPPADPPEDDPPPPDDCDVSSDKIYVIDKDRSDLHLFDPATQQLSVVGRIDCDSFSTPASMAVSRGGKAYVRYSDNSLFEIDLSQPSLPCVDTGYRNGSFGSFGMGYATDSSTTWHDQLYVSNNGQVAALDTDTWQRTVVTPLSSLATELTGNAAGQLWALAVQAGRGATTLQRVNQHTGAVAASVRLQQFPDPFEVDTFALAAWGGDLYAFYALNSSNTSEVWRITPAGQMTRVVANLGVNVVGAGVSTCAPGT